MGGGAGKGPYGVWKGANDTLRDETFGGEVLGFSFLLEGEAWRLVEGVQALPFFKAPEKDSNFVSLVLSDLNFSSLSEDFDGSRIIKDQTSWDEVGRG